eukprot:GHVU01100865.1.p1 GENE.GHVU01100865.1~~GHVU01100865.1.p1  ORF type:complete len:665 (+),score=58.14 GHVU01100865.1:76-2070(+)
MDKPTGHFISRWTILTIILFNISFVTGADTLDIRRPPAITEGPAKTIIIKENNHIPTQLHCKSSGSPTPALKWLHNGKEVADGDSYTHDYIANSRTLIISRSRLENEGYYQCVAFSQQTNKALSQVAHVRLAVTEEVEQEEPQVKTVNEGEPLTLTCNKGRAYPTPDYKWGIAEKTPTAAPVDITPTRRISVDDEGNLHFAYVTASDQHKTSTSPNGKIYKCGVYNPWTEIKTWSSPTRIVVNPNSVVPNTRPALRFNTPNQVAVQGQKLSLKCIFSGNPAPDITWSRVSGKAMSVYHGYKGEKRALVIDPIKVTDKDAYRCKASNSEGTMSQNIQVDVKKAPIFTQTPRSINKTEGEEASFYCSADADPPAVIKWFMNGELIKSSGLPRVTISESGTKLTVSDLCKDCAGPRTSDLFNIQCNASNEYGYDFADVYLNVLLTTKMMESKEREVMLDYYHPVSLPCPAESDDSTPITTTWKRDDRPFEQVADEIVVEASGALTIITENAPQGGKELVGTFTCLASNGYSNDTGTVRLVLPPFPVTPPPRTTIAPFPVAMVASTGGAVGFLLLLLLILCCCCYCYRDRGSQYKVEKYEIKHGFEPDKEIEKSSYQEYHRPIDHNLVTGSRGSIGSSITRIRDTDSISMASSLQMGASADNLIKPSK